MQDTMYLRDIFQNNGKPPKKGIFKDKKVKLLTPKNQSTFQDEVYCNLNRNISQMEEVEQIVYRKQLEQGTFKLGKKIVLSV